MYFFPFYVAFKEVPRDDLVVRVLWVGLSFGLGVWWVGGVGFESVLPSTGKSANLTKGLALLVK